MMISHAIHWVVVCSSVSSPHDAGNVTTSIAPVDMFSIYVENPYTYILRVYTDSLCTLASWAGGILNVYPCMHRNPTDPEKTNDAYLHFCIIATMNINCIDVQNITKSYMPSFTNLGKTQVI